MNKRRVLCRADWQAIHGLAFYGFMTVAAFVPVFRVWPLLWLVPLAAYAALVAVVPPLRTTFTWWPLGRVTARSLAATFVIAAGSCGALVAFHQLTHPDLTFYGRFLSAIAAGNVFVIGLLFAVLNALLEEIVFRGILFEAFKAQFGDWVAIVATAALFGYGHLHGYPPGPLGAVLAGVYGVCLGWLRVFTQGLGLPVAAHIVADATIMTLVIRSGAL